MTFNQELAQRFITGSILFLSLIACYIYAPLWIISLIILLTLVCVLKTEWPLFQLPWLTVIYPILPFSLLIALNQSSTHILLSLLLVTVSSYDAGGYLIGKQFGRIKLCPRISPQKTWEGVMGGFIFSVCATEIFLTASRFRPPLINVLLFCLLICSAATIGDLFESFLKRRVGLKDAGSLLPGHGGFLDRLDGFLGAILILYPWRTAFMKMLELT